MASLGTWLRELAPIGLLLAVVVVVIARLPRMDMGHSDAFRRRRVLNWLPLGLTYGLLYMGRYNLKISKGAFEEMVDAGIKLSNKTCSGLPLTP